MEASWLLALTAVFFCQSAQSAVVRERQRVLLLSFDGFRWDYLSQEFRHKYNLKLTNFDKLKDLGVYSPLGNIPPYYTQTFPSHYTAATGLYIESHGVVGNRFYDPKLNHTFTRSNNSIEWWEQGEPIWITAKKKKLRSATFFWPGGNVNFHGVMPDHYVPYDDTISFETRIATSLEWLKDGIDVVAAYFDQPDKAGHSFGPDSVQVAQAVQRMDALVGYLLTALEESDQLRNRVNVLLTSDHGMYPTDEKKMVSLYDFFRPSDAEITLYGPVIHIIPKKFSQEETLKVVSNITPHIKFYRHSDIPSSYHYRDNDRIPPIVGFADLGWQGFPNSSTFPWDRPKGRHGWGNEIPEMRPIFFAFGPAFKENFPSAPFETVNYYTLMCHLLDIKPAPNNGTMSIVNHLLLGSTR